MDLTRFRVPVVAAPMLHVSGPDLVVAACRAGVAGAFPSANCGSAGQLGEWLAEISERVPEGAGPVCVNLIVHRTNPRLEQDLAVIVASAAEVVITSVGSPDGLVDELHRAGRRVWADVASLRHLDKAAAAGVDGVVLLTAGAGGQTGWANPFAFVRAARARFPGLIALAGGIADGASIAAARVLGADLAYCGTRFIATEESLAAPEYRAAVVAGELDDVVLTDEVTGLPASLLRASFGADGPTGSGTGKAFDVGGTLPGANGRPSRWASAWSAGHAVSGVGAVRSVADVVAELTEEYERSAPAGRPAR
jgi:nitronate monooxygenase